MGDSPNGVIESVVKALGGTKVVAPLLWPDKGVDEARRLLCDCLNDDRAAKLDLSQALFILRMARGRGIHDGAAYLMATLGYGPPIPIEPKDEFAQLQREYIEATRVIAKIAERIERVQAPIALRSAA